MKNFNFCVLLSLAMITIYSCTAPDVYEQAEINLNSTRNFKISKEKLNIMNENLENLGQSEKIVVNDGIFHFKNPSAFLEFFKDFSVNKNALETKFKDAFVTKNDRKMQIIQNLESVRVQADLDAILKKNEDYIYIQDSTITFKNKHFYDFLFTDPSKNYIYIGNIIYLFEADATYLIFDGDKESITKCKRKELNVKNVIIDKKDKNTVKNARPFVTIPISNFEISGRKINPSDAGKRGTAGVDFNRVFTLFSTNTGQPLFTVQWGMHTQGYPERRTLGIWFNVNSNISLSTNFISKGYLNGIQIASNQYMAKPKPLNSGYDTEVNDFEYMNSETPQGGVLTITEAQKAQVTQTLTSNGGYFTTGQVPNQNIFY